MTYHGKVSILLACVCWASGLAAVTSLGAAKRGQAIRKPQAKAASVSTNLPEQSVEELVRLARRSVVLIKHFGRDGKADGVGSGFVLSTDGLIATSLHVIGEARPIYVQSDDGKEYEATEVHAWDRKLDLALIRIQAGKLPALLLGDSDKLKQGQSVVAIGHPLGLEHSVVQGVVSARRDFDGLPMIQVAIPIEPGNSGGPLLDRQGRVQGVLTLKSAMTANLGFAVPVNELKRLLEKPNPVPMNRWLTINALNPKEWTTVFGARWSQRAGRIAVMGEGKGFGGRSLCLSRQPVPERPYELAVTVRLEDESGAAGLVFGSDGADRHYGFYPTAGQLRLTRFEGPTVYQWTILETVPSPHYRPGEWNTIKVRFEPGKIFCYLNGHLVIEAEENAFTTGNVGLAKFRDTRAEFKDFQLGATVGSNAAVPSVLSPDLARKLEQLAEPPDESTVNALQASSGASQAFLVERAQKLERQAAQLRDLAETIHRREIEAQLVKVLAVSEPDADLFHAALLVSRLDNPDLDIEAYRRQLTSMAAEIAAQLPSPADADTRLAALTRYLFHENGFHGSRADYYNRANSYINQVLDDREGLPITLAVLFIELSRRIGLEGVSGLPLPNHFMVKRSVPDGTDQIIDVFNGGSIITRTEAQERVIELNGEGFRDADYRSATKREVILRMLRNLLGIAQREGSVIGSLRYLDVIVALSPEAARDRLSRARLRLQLGDVPGAKQDLKRVVEQRPSDLDLERIEELYRSL